jgi:hypothetical protein
MSGVVVSASGKGVQAVESSGDVFEGEQLLLGTDLHTMAISFGEQSLLSTRRLLLLPMGQGTMRIPHASRWRQPVVLVGEMAGSCWHQLERFRPVTVDGHLELGISSDRALSMVIVCESGEQSDVVAEMELWVNSPWKSGEKA